MKYLLKNKDKNVLLFSITKTQKEINHIIFDSFQVNVESIKDEALLLIDLAPTNESLHEWLVKRKILNNRAYVVELLEAISDGGNPYKYIDVSYGLSLNDSY